MTTKMPVAVVLMQVALELSRKDLFLRLAWTPRELNVEADDLTNDEFGRFDPALRVHVAWEELDLKMLHRLLETEAAFAVDIALRKEGRPRGDMPGRVRKKKKAKTAWG